MWCFIVIGGLVSLCEGPLSAGVCVSNITNYTMFVLGLFFFFIEKNDNLAFET